jgi:hypothetical protein
MLPHHSPRDRLSRVNELLILHHRQLRPFKLYTATASDSIACVRCASVERERGTHTATLCRSSPNTVLFGPALN